MLNLISNVAKKRTSKHRLDVESLTMGHDNAKDLHAVAPIGSDGSKSHAVAVVNGMIFDSSTTHAMLLCRNALDWCCNSVGGCVKTGHSIRFKGLRRGKQPVSHV